MIRLQVTIVALLLSMLGAENTWASPAFEQPNTQGPALGPPDEALVDEALPDEPPLDQTPVPETPAEAVTGAGQVEPKVQIIKIRKFGFGQEEKVPLDRASGEIIGWADFYSRSGRDDLALSYQWRTVVRTLFVLANLSMLLPATLLLGLSTYNLAVLAFPAQLGPSPTVLGLSTGDIALMGLGGMLLIGIPVVIASGLSSLFLDEQPASLDVIEGLVPAYQAPVAASAME